jgi:hypothetical protein
MGRHRMANPVIPTAIDITTYTLEITLKYKSRRENKDQFIKKVFLLAEKQGNTK